MAARSEGTAVTRRRWIVGLSAPLLVLGLASPVQAADFDIIGTIAIGAAPYPVVISPDGQTVYTASHFGPGGRVVQLSSASSLSVTQTITGISDYPMDLALTPSGATLYVANWQAGNVQAVNTSTFAITNISVGFAPYGVAVSPSGSTAYSADYGSNQVSVINTTSNTQTSTISLGAGAGPYGVAVSPDGSRLYVAGENSNRVYVIDTGSSTVLGNVAVGTRPTRLAVSPDGSTLYVTNYGSDSVSVISTTSLTVVATIAVGDAPSGVAVAPNGGNVYVANAGGSVSVISAASNAVINTITVAGEPFGTAISPDGSRLYVTQNQAASMTVIQLPRSSTVSSSPEAPTAPLQQFVVGAGTQATECATLAPSWVDWPGIASQRSVGWGVSYAPWPHGGAGGWVCGRQPIWTGAAWSAGS